MSNESEVEILRLTFLRRLPLKFGDGEALMRLVGEAEFLPPLAPCGDCWISGCSVERVPPGDFLTCPMKCMLMWSFSFSTDCSL